MTEATYRLGVSEIDCAFKTFLIKEGSSFVQSPNDRIEIRYGGQLIASATRGVNSATIRPYIDAATGEKYTELAMVSVNPENNDGIDALETYRAFHHEIIVRVQYATVPELPFIAHKIVGGLCVDKDPAFEPKEPRGWVNLTILDGKRVHIDTVMNDKPVILRMLFEECGLIASDYNAPWMLPDMKERSWVKFDRFPDKPGDYVHIIVPDLPTFFKAIVETPLMALKIIQEYRDALNTNGTLAVDYQGLPMAEFFRKNMTTGQSMYGAVHDVMWDYAILSDSSALETHGEPKSIYLVNGAPSERGDCVATVDLGML